MDSMGVSRSNALLEKIRRNINVINSRSEEFKRATYESGCRMEEWAEKVVTTEKRHHTIYVTALSELEEARAKEQEIARIARERHEADVKEEFKCRQEIDRLHDQIENLGVAKGALPEKHLNLENSIESEKQKYMQRKDYVDQASSKLDLQLKEMQDNINLHQSALGLNVDVIEDGCLCFVFTYIDERDHSAEFKVTVATSNKQFKALECDPMVAEYKALSDALEKDEKLVQFIRKIRKAFKRYARG